VGCLGEWTIVKQCDCWFMWLPYFPSPQCFGNSTCEPSGIIFHRSPRRTGTPPVAGSGHAHAAHNPPPPSPENTQDKNILLKQFNFACQHIMAAEVSFSDLWLYIQTTYIHTYAPVYIIRFVKMKYIYMEVHRLINKLLEICVTF
jgi:hypothetical protein